MLESKISRLDRFLIRVFGSILFCVDERGIAYYIFKCNIHGYAIAPASGHYRKILCGACLKEKGESLNRGELHVKGF